MESAFQNYFFLGSASQIFSPENAFQFFFPGEGPKIFSLEKGLQFFFSIPPTSPQIINGRPLKCFIGSYFLNVWTHNNIRADRTIALHWMDEQVYPYSGQHYIALFYYPTLWYLDPSAKECPFCDSLFHTSCSSSFLFISFMSRCVYGGRPKKKPPVDFEIK